MEGLGRTCIHERRGVFVFLTCSLIQGLERAEVLSEAFVDLLTCDG